MPFEIPESWAWARLGSVSTYGSSRIKINAKDAGPDTWGLDLEDIEKGGNLLQRKKIGERKVIGDKTVFCKGEVLYSKLRPYLLKVLIADEDGVCTPELIPFHLYGEIISLYVVHFLKSPYANDVINKASYGIKMPRVSTETMTSLFVPIPPFKEQYRIVSKIETLLPHLKALE